MRIEAQSLRSSAMELAHVSSGVPRAEDRTHRVLYFDMRLHAQGQAPVTVDRHNALFDLLMFPMLHEKGVGGFFIAKDDCVCSTTGVKLSLQAYTRAMMFFPERAPALPEAPGAGVRTRWCSTAATWRTRWRSSATASCRQCCSGGATSTPDPGSMWQAAA